MKAKFAVIVGLLAAISICDTAFAQVPTTTTVSMVPPLNVTGDQDHQNMMDQLGITSLRPGVDGYNKTAPNYQNNDESKANPYPVLPNPLVFPDGKPVKSAKDWWKKRRPQIESAFDSEIYGKLPKVIPAVTWQVVNTTNEMNGTYPVVTKKLIGHVDNSSDPDITVELHMSLSTPADAKGAVPVMLEFGFPEGFPFPSFPGFRPRPAQPVPAPGAAPIAPPPPSWQQQCLAHGYGYAELDPGSFQADNAAGLTKGIIGLCNHGNFRKPDDWGALRAWAWGADRALDYFQTDPAVDAKQVGIEGLSRYGKATLVTMAYDQRFAIAFVGSSGEGGAKLWRRNWGESEGNLAGGEYYWLAGNFLKYDSTLTVNDLPVDQHELIAMCAPRPTFISCGSPNVEGTWLDDRGMFMATVAASPVYVLLGKKGLSTDVMPPEKSGLMDGDLAWRQHEGPHSNVPNWPYFLDFASRYLHAPS